jgi:transglutaminase-like putative cysteine protease
MVAMNLPDLKQLPRDARDTLFVLVVITWVAAPLVRQVPLWCSAMGAVVIVWRGWLALRNRPLPSTIWRFGLLALAVLGTLLSYRTLLGRDAGVTLLMVLLALKTLELRARRDAFVVFFLSFFLMLTQFFYSQSLVTALAMLLALWGLLTALVIAHMPVGRPTLWLAARLAGGMTLLGAPIMLALFMLFPRIAPLWGLPGDAMAGRSGLSGSMSVGNIASLALDDSVSMRLRFDGPVPQPAEMYFRGPVLNEFDGQHWTTTPWFEQLSKFSPPQLTTQGEPVNYQVTLEPNQQPWLLTLDATPTAPRVARQTPRQTPDGQWLLTRPVTELLRYQVQSYTSYQSDLDLRPSQFRRALALPPNANPRTWLWAQELAKTHPDPAQRVQAVLAHLRSGGYMYTLEPGVYGRDSADEFWFDRKLGFCEHIAAAFVIVMRASNIPARVVTGYQGAERNPLDGFWTVRQSDAHAWAEVWLSGQGWVRVDPTGAVSPGRIGSFQRLATPRGAVATALLGTVSPEVVITLRAAWDAVNNRWNQWVLNYTQSRQMDLLKSLGFETPSWEDLIYVLCGLIVTVSLAGALWSAWERQHQDPWHKLLTRVRQALLNAGVVSPAQSSPRQLMQALQSQSDTRLQRPDLQRWLLQLEAVRYAPQAGDPKHAEARRSNAKSPQLAADAKQRIATLQRELTRLLPLRTP